MNNSYSHCVILAFLITLMLPAAGKDSVSFPAGSAAWTIAISDSPNHKGPPFSGPKLQKIEAVQDTHFLHNAVTWSNGTKRDYFSIVGTDMFMVQETRTSVTLKQTGPYAHVPYLPSCFDWVQPSLLQEKDPISYQDKMCFHYKGTMPLSPSIGAAGQGETILGEAWIDSKTMLPVALDDGIYLATFTFSKDPPAPLKLPPGFKELYESYK